MRPARSSPAWPGPRRVCAGCTPQRAPGARPAAAPGAGPAAPPRTPRERGRGRGSPGRRSRTRRGFDRLGQAELGEPRPVGAVGVVGHARELGLLAASALLRPGGGQGARGCGEVEPEVGRNPGVVVDRRPRAPEVTGGSVRFVDDREVEACHLLPVQPLLARQGCLQGPRTFRWPFGCVDVLAVHEGGVGGEHDDRSGGSPQGELDRVGGGARPQLVQDRAVFQRAHSDHRGPVPDQPPGLGGLDEEVQGGHGDQDPAVRKRLQRARGGHDRFAGPGNGHDRLPSCDRAGPGRSEPCRAGPGRGRPVRPSGCCSRGSCRRSWCSETSR